MLRKEASSSIFFFFFFFFFFLSLWYDSTWDWTHVSRAIGEHSNHHADVRYMMNVISKLRERAVLFHTWISVCIRGIFGVYTYDKYVSLSWIKGKGIVQIGFLVRLFKLLIADRVFRLRNSTFQSTIAWNK